MAYLENSERTDHENLTQRNYKELKEELKLSSFADKTAYTETQRKSNNIFNY